MQVFRNTVEVFCAFCRSPRRVAAARRIGFRHIISAALASVLLMVLIWREFDPRVFTVFVIFLAVAETFIQLRWRMSLPCKQCGFDPVVYKKNPENAAEKVRGHLQRRREDPRYLLAQPLNLPVRRIPPPDDFPLSPESRPGRLVSKSV